MAQFKYRAKNRDGQEEKGVTDASDLETASTLLAKKNLFVVDIQPVKEGGVFNLSFFHPKVGLKDKIIFTEQLAVMIKAGLTIVSALKSLKTETGSKELSKALDKIIIDIESGSTFAAALAKYPKIFDQIYLSTVNSGEKSGKLDQVLERLANQMDKSYDLVSKVRGALIYPAVIFTAMIGVGVFVLIYILPKLKDIFVDSGAPMPKITVIIMALGDNLAALWYYYLVGLIILIAAYTAFSKTKTGININDRLKMKIPVFGPLFKKAYMANFTRTFASLSASGLPVLEIFHVGQTVIPNSIYQKELENIATKVENGVQISTALHQSKLFPSMVGQLAMVGEKSGRMDQVFDTLAKFYEREVDNITKNLSTLIEPIMMLVLGLGIGVLIVAILQPIYGLVSVI